MKLIFLKIVLFCAVSTSLGQTLILFPELYFGTEIDSSFYNQQWVGLYQNGGGSYLLSDIEIDFVNAHHIMVDEEGEKSGIQVSCNPRNPIIVLSGPENFNLGEVRACTDYNSIIYPGDTTVINLKGRRYLLTATGKKKTLPSGEIVVSDYKLFIENQRGIIQMIGEAAFFDVNMFEIFWAGDLNDDQQLDIIIDLSYKYSFTEMVLFLSSDDSTDQVFYESGRKRKHYD